MVCETSGATVGDECFEANAVATMATTTTKVIASPKRMEFFTVLAMYRTGDVARRFAVDVANGTVMP
jgi:hypothetical protein